MSIQEKIFEDIYSSSSIDEHRILSSERVIKVLRVFAELKPNRILDVGCSDGTISIALKKVSGAELVCGVDISKKAVELARSKGVKAQVVNVDEEKLPFESEYFDAVHAGEIIEHLLDPDHLFDEIHRVLKKRGAFVLTTPNLSSLVNRLLLLIGFQPLLTPASLRYDVGGMRIRKYALERRRLSTPCGHVRSFTYLALLELLELHGFRVRRVLGSGIPWLSFPLSIIDKISSKIPFLAGVMIFICEKL
jgi:2-polyprenyl-3-methyl-5-hydroxy-6-metoxy-1,4-benzoquinol methylase